MSHHTLLYPLNDTQKTRIPPNSSSMYTTDTLSNRLVKNQKYTAHNPLHPPNSKKRYATSFNQNLSGTNH